MMPLSRSRNPLPSPKARVGFSAYSLSIDVALGIRAVLPSKIRLQPHSTSMGLVYQTQHVFLERADAAEALSKSDLCSRMVYTKSEEYCGHESRLR